MVTSDFGLRYNEHNEAGTVHLPNVKNVNPKGVMQMKNVKKGFRHALKALLTGVVMIMPLFTCCFIFHQPQLPEEINDFRRYAE